MSKVTQTRLYCFRPKLRFKISCSIFDSWWAQNMSVCMQRLSRIWHLPERLLLHGPKRHLSYLIPSILNPIVRNGSSWNEWYVIVAYRINSRMPLCHHPWNHHQNVLRTMITLDDNKIMMINHFMKCVTHKLSRSYLSKSESKCHIKVCQFTDFALDII